MISSLALTLCCEIHFKRGERGKFYGATFICYTLSEAWSGVNWADFMAAQGTMLWTEYRPVIKIGPKGTLGSHEIRPIHSAPSLGQSIAALEKFSSRGAKRGEVQCIREKTREVCPHDQ